MSLSGKTHSSKKAQEVYLLHAETQCRQEAIYAQAQSVLSQAVV